MSLRHLCVSRQEDVISQSSFACLHITYEWFIYIIEAMAALTCLVVLGRDMTKLSSMCTYHLWYLHIDGIGMFIDIRMHYDKACHCVYTLLLCIYLRCIMITLYPCNMLTQNSGHDKDTEYGYSLLMSVVFMSYSVAPLHTFIATELRLRIWLHTLFIILLPSQLRPALYGYETVAVLCV